MIAIDVTMSTKNNEDLIVDDTVVLIEESYQNVYDFFKNCIDQNVLLNITVDVPIEESSTVITRYFATTKENAQTFEQAFSDMTAEFSMKKFWDYHGFNISVSHHEIDFDTVDDTFELVGSQGQVWGIPF